jgi:hypothetical protein
METGFGQMPWAGPMVQFRVTFLAKALSGFRSGPWGRRSYGSHIIHGPRGRRGPGPWAGLGPRPQQGRQTSARKRPGTEGCVQQGFNNLGS